MSHSTSSSASFPLLTIKGTTSQIPPSTTIEPCVCANEITWEQSDITLEVVVAFFEVETQVVSPYEEIEKKFDLK